ncbi:MAG: MYG1 family protein [Candidatus Paceibacteria bacterium]
MKTVVTHNGSFHADDVFSIAAFQLLFGKDINVVRTRDEEMIDQADYVVDVGGVYDPANNRYDHHQNNAPVRENGIPYSGFGLVWKHYGEQICGSAAVALKIDEKLCQPIDLGDNGISIWELGKYDLPALEWDGIVKAWQADSNHKEDMDTQFFQVVEFVRSYLQRLVQKTHTKIEQKQKAITLYETSEFKNILVSDEYLSRSLFVEYPEVQVLLFPKTDTNQWVATAVEEDSVGFATKVSFPAHWAGLRDEELATVSGIPDAAFCHKNCHLFVAGSREGALAAAQRAK